MPEPTPDPITPPTPDPPPPPQPASWLESLPADLKALPSLSKFKEPAALAKSYVELEKNFGNALRPPPADADQKTLDAFYRQLGRPVTPEEYQITKPDDIELDEGTEKRIRTQAYRLGLNSRQTQEMVNAYAGEVREAVQIRGKAVEKADSELKEKWGGNYERNTAIVGRALNHLDPEGALSKELARTGLGNHPQMIDLFLNYGKLLVEDGLIVGDVGGIATRESAKAKIAEMQSDPKHPYHTSKPGDHIFEEFRKLFQIAYD
jgi:hypothetical protein